MSANERIEARRLAKLKKGLTGSKVIEYADMYKVDHKSQYPINTTNITSNMTARMTRIHNIDEVTIFGVQYFIKKYLLEAFDEDFFTKDKEEVLASYEAAIKEALNLDEFDTSHIAELHDLGYLPLEIRCIPEGRAVPIKCPFLTVSNTDERFFWLTNYIETMISSVVWPMINSATIAKYYKSTAETFFELTGSEENRWFLDFQCHDFSFRGMFGPEAAIMSGMAHLISFSGTDTLPAIRALKEYYDAVGFVGGSVPATEHSVQCAGGQKTEFDTYQRLINEVYPSGIVSIVSDTWDFWNVVDNYLPALKDDILARDGKVVIRPDSGCPIKTISGYLVYQIGAGICSEDAIGEAVKHAWTKGYEAIKYKNKYHAIREDKDTNELTLKEISRSEAVGLVRRLDEIFGSNINEKGFKELNSHIGAIYGDSITMDRFHEILTRLMTKNYASTNVVLGIGSFSYQYNTRDTFGQAIKATFARINNEDVELMKNPKTDDGTKKSAQGLIVVTETENGYTFRDQATIEEFTSAANALRPIFKDSEMLIDMKYTEVTANIKI